LSGYAGVFLFHRGDACRVSAPPELDRLLRDAVRRRRGPDVFRSDALAALLGDRVEKVLGPNWYGYVDRAGFRPTALSGCREITGADLPAVSVSGCVWGRRVG